MDRQKVVPAQERCDSNQITIEEFEKIKNFREKKYPGSKGIEIERRYGIDILELFKWALQRSKSTHDTNYADALQRGEYKNLKIPIGEALILEKNLALLSADLEELGLMDKIYNWALGNNNG